MDFLGIDYTKLDLEYLKFMAAIPSSIERLQKLEQLDLDFAEGLERLPEEIGDMTNLCSLNLRESGIKSLPSSIARISRPWHLNFSGTPIDAEIKRLRGSDRDQYVLRIVQSSPSLIHLDITSIHGASKNHETEGWKKMLFTLASRRAATRKSFRKSPNLWPLVLKHATRAFSSSVGSLPAFNYDSDSAQQSDAIYHLLTMNQEFFLEVINNCDSDKRTRRNNGKLTTDCPTEFSGVKRKR
jgi:hypothetical protein